MALDRITLASFRNHAATRLDGTGVTSSEPMGRSPEMGGRVGPWARGVPAEEPGLDGVSLNGPDVSRALRSAAIASTRATVQETTSPAIWSPAR